MLAWDDFIMVKAAISFIKEPFSPRNPEIILIAELEFQL